MRLRILGAAVAAVLAGSAPAQAGLEANLSTLVGDQAVGYLNPLQTAMSASINAGAYRGASIPVAGLTLRLDLQASYISFGDDSKTYTAPAFGGYPEAEVPTVVGDPGGVAVDHGSVSGLTFQYPGGFDMKNFATPVPQLTIGNVLGTRAMVRWAKVNFGDEDLGEFELWGLGAQHSLSQYLTLPVDLAIGGMYQQFSMGTDLVKADTFNWAVTASKKFGAVVTVEPYVGVGMDSMEMEANYTSGDEEIKVDFDRTNDFRGTLGANLRLPVVSLHFEGYLAAENGIAGSLSFGI